MAAHALIATFRTGKHTLCQGVNPCHVVLHLGNEQLLTLRTLEVSRLPLKHRRRTDAQRRGDNGKNNYADTYRPVHFNVGRNNDQRAYGNDSDNSADDSNAVYRKLQKDNTFVDTLRIRGKHSRTVTILYSGHSRRRVGNHLLDSPVRTLCDRKKHQAKVAATINKSFISL